MVLKLKKEFVIIAVLVIIVIVESLLLIKFWPRKAKIALPAKPAAVVKVALVIDDWGYSLNNVHFLKEINIPLDISVLPFLTYSRAAAEEAHLNNKEVMLHLPLEPHPNSQIRLESRVILTSMPEDKVIQILDDALKNVPFVQGINNHMGSLATEKESLMAIIFREMKKRNLFFVDSMVTPKTICKELAKKAQIKFGQRLIFLDNENNDQYIRKQFLLLIKKARKQSGVIGIGHDRSLTLSVIKELAPEMEKQGIKFVFASELVK